MSTTLMTGRFRTDIDMVDKFNISRKCVFCGNLTAYEFGSLNEYTRFIEGDRRYRSGYLLQDAFPDFDADFREFYKTGMCIPCQKLIFSVDDEEE